MEVECAELEVEFVLSSGLVRVLLVLGVEPEVRAATEEWVRCIRAGAHIDEPAACDEAAVRVVHDDPDLGTTIGADGVLDANVDRIDARIRIRVAGLEALATCRQIAGAVRSAVIPVD